MKRLFIFYLLCNFAFSGFAQLEQQIIKLYQCIGNANYSEGESILADIQKEVDENSYKFFYSIFYAKKALSGEIINCERCTQYILSLSNDLEANPQYLEGEGENLIMTYKLFNDYMLRYSKSNYPAFIRQYKKCFGTDRFVHNEYYIDALEGACSYFMDNDQKYETIEILKELINVVPQDDVIKIYSYHHILARNYRDTNQEGEALEQYFFAANICPPELKNSSNPTYVNILRESFELYIKHSNTGRAIELGNVLLDFYNQDERHTEDLIYVNISLARLLIKEQDLSGLKYYEDGISLILESKNYKDEDKNKFLEDLAYIYDVRDIPKKKRKFPNIVNKKNVTKGVSYATEEYIDSLLVEIEKLEHSEDFDITLYTRYINQVCQNYLGKQAGLQAISLTNHAIDVCKNKGVFESEYAMLFMSQGNIYSHLYDWKNACNSHLNAHMLFSERKSFNFDYVRNLINLASAYNGLDDSFYAKLFIDEALLRYNEIDPEKRDYSVLFELLSEATETYKRLGEEGQTLHFIDIALETVKDTDYEMLQIWLQKKIGCLSYFERADEALALAYELKKIPNPIFKSYDYLYEPRFYANDDNCIDDLKLKIKESHQRVKYLYNEFKQEDLEKYWDSTASLELFDCTATMAKFNTAEMRGFTYNEILYLKNFHIPYSNQIVDSKEYDWHEVQSQLQKNDVAVEIFKMAKYPSYKTRKFYYAALIIRKNDKAPILVELCDKDSLENLVYMNTITSAEEYSENIYKSDSRQIYELIWQPLIKYIPEKACVYVSAGSAASEINFCMIPYDGKRLMDIYKVHNVYSTSRIPCISHVRFQSASLYGDIDYEHSTAFTPETQKVSDEQIQFGLTRSDEEDRGSLKALPASGIEIGNIAELLRNHGVIVLENTKGDATESSVKIFSGKSPDILHFSTHGLFYQPYIKSFNTGFQENPYITDAKTLPFENMRRSLLMMAGANKVWRDSERRNSIEDGILNAYEISKLDLKKCKLATLSACQTALGERLDTEGHSGLIRGFKIAGVQTIVATLWKVSDKETQEFMNLFYYSLLEKGIIHEAFMEAIIQFKVSHPHPYYWAGFLLVE